MQARRTTVRLGGATVRVNREIIQTRQSEEAHYPHVLIPFARGFNGWKTVEKDCEPLALVLPLMAAPTPFLQALHRKAQSMWVKAASFHDCFSTDLERDSSGPIGRAPLNRRKKKEKKALLGVPLALNARVKHLSLRWRRRPESGVIGLEYGFVRWLEGGYPATDGSDLGEVDYTTKRDGGRGRPTTPTPREFGPNAGCRSSVSCRPAAESNRPESVEDGRGWPVALGRALPPQQRSWEEALPPVSVTGREVAPCGVETRSWGVVSGMVVSRADFPRLADGEGEGGDRPSDRPWPALRTAVESDLSTDRKSGRPESADQMWERERYQPSRPAPAG
ncbi:hypothetical protein KSP40_PGU015248 [Platanthera guangdongensis]|uniref:Uncharacterized protein n=1 Tax=Platanthera guangdongensis TaxID=2320717 RepID=A0ABR2LHP1_9ASPA